MFGLDLSCFVMHLLCLLILFFEVKCYMLILLVLSLSVYDLKSKTKFLVCVIVRTQKLTLPAPTLFLNFSKRETTTILPVK